MVLHIGVIPSSHCRCGGGGSFLPWLWCFTYGAAYRSYILPLIVDVSVLKIFDLVMVFYLWCFI